MRVSSFLKASVFAAAATVIGSTAALATPINSSITNFTWDPAGVGISDAGAFTASNITVNDFAQINVTDPTHVTENAILSIQSFNTITPGLVSSSGTVSGANPYQLYFVVSSTSHLAPVLPGDLSGKFDTLSYTLYGYGGNNCTFSATTAGVSSSCLGSSIVLASGSLLNDPNATNVASIQGSVDITQPFSATNQPVPNAAVDVTVDSKNSLFWLSPASLLNLFFETSFTNTTTEVQEFNNGTSDIFVVGGCRVVQDHSVCLPGGGTLTLESTPIPEPVTLSIFGAGLVGAAALRRRKAKKA